MFSIKIVEGGSGLAFTYLILSAISSGLTSWLDRELKVIGGLYPKYVRLLRIPISALVVVDFNVDSIKMGKTLWVDDEVRQAVVVASEK